MNRSNIVNQLGKITCFPLLYHLKYFVLATKVSKRRLFSTCKYELLMPPISNAVLSGLRFCFLPSYPSSFSFWYPVNLHNPTLESG